MCCRRRVQSMQKRAVVEVVAARLVFDLVCQDATTAARLA